jgi:hypothetical protein
MPIERRPPNFMAVRTRNDAPVRNKPAYGARRCFPARSEREIAGGLRSLRRCPDLYEV